MLKPIESLGKPTDFLPENVGTLLRNAVSRFGNRPALHFEGYDELTYAQVGALTAGTRDFLFSLGLKKGDRVLAAIDNRPAFQILWLTCADAGLVFVPMNPAYGISDAHHVISDSDPAVAIWMANTYDRLASYLPKNTIPLLIDEPRPGAELFELIEGDWSTLGRGVTQSDFFTIGYTSGTTGLPKGCIADHLHWLLLAKLLAWGLELDESDRLLTAQPCFYGDPQYNLVAVLWAGAHLTVLSRFSSSTFWKKVKESKATKFWAIGTMPAMLMNTPPEDGEKEHHLVAAWCLGVPRPLHKAMEERFNVRWLEAFGTSETGVNMAERIGSKPEYGEGWLGEPIPYTEVRLVDYDGKLIEGDGEGFVEFKTPLLVRGYWSGKTHTVKEFPPESWFRTGDIFERVNAKYRFVRREKDIIRRSGENISCREVEEVLRSHPQIIDAAVIPSPDEIRGEEVWAFIQPKEEAINHIPSPNELAAFALKRLAKHKVPRYLTYVNSFPMTPSERIEKHKLPTLVSPGQTYDRVQEKWI